MELMLSQPFQETPSLQDLQWQSTIVPGNDEKESIIANADFRLCSGLARRRLSSKKRKKPMEGGQEGEHAAMEMGGSRSSHSPTEGPTPISYYQNSTHRTPCYYQGTPATVPGGVSVPPGGQYLSVAQGFPLMSTPSIGMLSKQFSNPVLNQLNYRFIQDQRMFVPALGPALSSTEPGGAQPSSLNLSKFSLHSGIKKPFKWCYAHVMVARQIHQHQMHIKATSAQPLVSCHHSTGQSNTATLPQQEHHHIQHLQHQQQHLQHQQKHLQHQQQHLQHQQIQHLQHQHQQLLLLQMYGCLPRNGVVPGGYVTLPYAPTLQDLQLGYVPPPQGMSLAPSAVSLVKPAPTTTCVAAAPELNVHLSGALQLAPTVATLAPVPDLTNVFPGAPWITPVPVFGSCVVNPFHPGVLTTSWVK